MKETLIENCHYYQKKITEYRKFQKTHGYVRYVRIRKLIIFGISVYYTVHCIILLKILQNVFLIVIILS